jgi:hypothetical protein
MSCPGGVAGEIGLDCEVVDGSRDVERTESSFDEDLTHGFTGRGRAERTFSMSLSLPRLVPLPAAGTEECLSSLPLPEPSSEPCLRLFDVAAGLVVDLGWSCCVSSLRRFAASSLLSSVSLRSRS